MILLFSWKNFIFIFRSVLLLSRSLECIKQMKHCEKPDAQGSATIKNTTDTDKWSKCWDTCGSDHSRKWCWATVEVSGQTRGTIYGSKCTKFSMLIGYISWSAEDQGPHN